MPFVIEDNFTYHPPKGDQTERYKLIRAQGLAFAKFIIEKCSVSRESTIAITKIEEAVFWANASIARNE